MSLLELVNKGPNEKKIGEGEGDRSNGRKTFEQKKEICGVYHGRLVSVTMTRKFEDQFRNTLEGREVESATEERQQKNGIENEKGSKKKK